jgi:hypothetical protein
MSRKFTRRQFIKTSAIGLAVTGAAITSGKIILDSARNDLPDPYPVLPDKKPAIPSPEKKPFFFNKYQYGLVAVLAALIVPSDDGPGATEAGVADYIDRLVHGSEKKQKEYAKGLNWIDGASQKQYGKVFINLTIKEQIELLADISKVYRHTYRLLDRISRKIDEFWNDLFGFGKNARFFITIRKDVFYGYYSNPVSWKVVGYYGPPQPAGYEDYSEPPSSARYTGTVRPISNRTCQNCHFDQLKKENHEDLFDCLDCHDLHFPLQKKL